MQLMCGRYGHHDVSAVQVHAMEFRQTLGGSGSTGRTNYVKICGNNATVIPMQFRLLGFSLGVIIG